MSELDFAVVLLILIGVLLMHIINPPSATGWIPPWQKPITPERMARIRAAMARDEWERTSPWPRRVMWLGFIVNGGLLLAALLWFG